MRTINIPHEAWTARLNEFTNVHEGWLVSLDVLSPDIGAQPELENVPLLGVSVDHIDDDDSIVISIGRSATDHLTHVVHAVTRIDVEQTDNGADAALQVKSVDGTKTILRFRSPALPETVDGLVH